MPREIPAVYGRDVRRLKDVESLELVPVEEVALMSAHPVERLEHLLEALDHLPARQQAEIVRARYGKQLKPDVRGRRPQRDNRLRIFLEVVGRQPLRLLADESLEESPVVQRITHRAAAIVGPPSTL